MKKNNQKVYEMDRKVGGNPGGNGILETKWRTCFTEGENKYFRCCPYIKQDKDLDKGLLGLPQWLSTSLVAQLVKNPPAVQETLTGFLGLEDPLEKG